MTTDTAAPLLRRIRWANVARLAAALGAVALLFAWPRLGSARPALPPAEPEPMPVRHERRQAPPPPRSPERPRTHHRRRAHVKRTRPRSPTVAKRPRAVTPPPPPKPAPARRPAPPTEFFSG